MKVISVEVDDEFAKALETLEQFYLDRPMLIKNLLLSGLKQYRVEMAIQKYLEGEVSTWKAAEIAGISLRKMNKILQEKGIEMHYFEKSLKEDLELE
jgi:predicted HTH domain antitoxin